MKQPGRTAMIVVASLFAAAFVFVLISESNFFVSEVWTRKAPLDHPISVTKVAGGAIALADGRTLRAAGIRRRDGVSPEDFDLALTAIVAQGVEVTRDLGDGRAFLVAEPKFKNWCGTRGYGGNPWAHWAGTFVRCPVSELLIHCAYARAEVEQPGIDPKERARLEGVESILGIAPAPVRVLGHVKALDYDAGISTFDNLDELFDVPSQPSNSP